MSWNDINPVHVVVPRLHIQISWPDAVGVVHEVCGEDLDGILPGRY